MPVTKGVLEHLQQAYTETSGCLANFLSNAHLLPPNQMYILYGAMLSPEPVPTSVSPGLAYYNGELFQIDGNNFVNTPDPGSEPLMVMYNKHIYSPDADPVIFTDGTARDVLPRRTINIVMGIPGGGTTGSYICDFYKAVRICPPVPRVQDGLVWDGIHMVRFDCNYNTFFLGTGSTMDLRFDVSKGNVAVGATTRLQVTVPGSISSISMVPPPLTQVETESGSLSSIITPSVTIYATYLGFANAQHRIGLAVY
jgi:hypothetical protein